MANEYASLADMKKTLELTGESFADPDIELALTAASRGVDNVCSRRFYLDADDDQVRYYTPDDDCRLSIDDLVVLNTLQADPGGDGTFEQTWTQNTDFVLTPLNAGADGRPYTTIRLHPNSSRYFPTGVPRSVKVTGQFGWAAVPDAVKAATMILASKLIRRVREAPFGVVAFGLEGGVMQIARTDPDVMFLLNDYTLTTIAVA